MDEIIKKHKKIIDAGFEWYRPATVDSEHALSHVNDVMQNVYELYNIAKGGALEGEDINWEAVIIGAAWHDAGRHYMQAGHEAKSAQMVYDALIKEGYSKSFAQTVHDSVVNHKSSSVPFTPEGHLVKDADKVGLVCLGRWEDSIKNNFKLESILNSIFILRERFHFAASKTLYDKRVCELINFLTNYIFENKK